MECHELAADNLGTFNSYFKFMLFKKELNKTDFNLIPNCGKIPLFG